jgi:hypothetical protein
MSSYTVTYETATIKVCTIVGVDVIGWEFRCCGPSASLRSYTGFILGIAVTTRARSA